MRDFSAQYTRRMYKTEKRAPVKPGSSALSARRRRYCGGVPEDKMEILRQGIDAFNARDIDRLVELFQPDAELHSALTTALAGRTAYHGREGFREWHRELEEAWSEIQLGLEQVFKEDDRLLAYYEMSARGRQSGATVTMPIAHLMRFRDGHIAHLTTFTDRDTAMREFQAAEPAGKRAEP